MRFGCLASWPQRVVSLIHISIGSLILKHIVRSEQHHVEVLHFCFQPQVSRHVSSSFITIVIFFPPAQRNIWGHPTSPLMSGRNCAHAIHKSRSCSCHNQICQQLAQQFSADQSPGPLAFCIANWSLQQGTLYKRPHFFHLFFRSTRWVLDRSQRLWDCRR